MCVCVCVCVCGESVCVCVWGCVSRSPSPLQAFEQAQRDELVGRQLWLDDKWAEFQEEQDNEQKVKLAENNRYKRYRSIIQCCSVRVMS